MAHTASSLKRIRQNHKRRARNRWRLRTLRAAVKEFRDKLAHGSVEEAGAALKTCQSVIDRTAQKGAIHRGQADRRKRRLNAALIARKKSPA